jgi:orotidine-5'-phosphate decarboxylase
MIIDKLYERAVNVSPVCVGLDFRIEFLPEYMEGTNIPLTRKIFEFNKAIIDATHDLVACYKLQIACYEAYGIEGMKAYSETVKYLKEKDLLIIGDVKRGDISSTAKMYAKAHFEGDFEVDFMTINAYMGEDSVSPYYEHIKNSNKGLFVLLKTSNDSAKDFQDLKVSDEELYLKVGSKISDWGKDFIGESKFSSIGAVVGLTNPDDFEKIKKASPNTFYLIPGYGAQGGSSKELKILFKDGLCGVVNSSRGIIAAHKGVCEDKNFNEITRKAVMSMKEEIATCL